MAKRYRVTLEAEERERLRRLISAGKGAARRLTHARVLLQADEAEGGPARADRAIAEALGVGVPTVERVRQRFVGGGPEAALSPRPSRRRYRRKLAGAGEAHLVAPTCSAPPDGPERRTLRLLAGRMVALGPVASPSPETVRGTPEKTRSSRGRGRWGASRRRPTPGSCSGGGMCRRSITGRTTRSARWWAWTRRASG